MLLLHLRIVGIVVHLRVFLKTRLIPKWLVASTGALPSFHNLIAYNKSTMDGYSVMANNQNGENEWDFTSRIYLHGNELTVPTAVVIFMFWMPKPLRNISPIKIAICINNLPCWISKENSFSCIPQGEWRIQKRGNPDEWKKKSFTRAKLCQNIHSMLNVQWSRRNIFIYVIRCAHEMNQSFQPQTLNYTLTHNHKSNPHKATAVNVIGYSTLPRGVQTSCNIPGEKQSTATARHASLFASLHFKEEKLCRRRTFHAFIFVKKKSKCGIRDKTSELPIIYTVIL